MPNRSGRRRNLAERGETKSSKRPKRYVLAGYTIKEEYDLINAMAYRKGVSASSYIIDAAMERAEEDNRQYTRDMQLAAERGDLVIRHPKNIPKKGSSE